MGIPLYDFLDQDEAIAVAEFLVEIAGLERAITKAVVDHYANPAAVDDFVDQFLEHATMGPKIEALKRILPDDEYRPVIVSRLKEVQRARNALAHGLPKVQYPSPPTDYDPDWEPERSMVFHHRELALAAAQLHDLSAMASWLTAVISGWDWLVQPTPSFRAPQSEASGADELVPPT